MKKLQLILLFSFILFSVFASSQSTETHDVVLATMTPIPSIKKVKYSFDVSLLEKLKETKVEKEINGATVSILNNTTGKTELENHTVSNSNFDFSFTEGNHYTITIQKDGFKTKKLEAFVKTEGCLLCFEGLNMVDNHVSDALTSDNKSGVILANVEMVRK